MASYVYVDNSNVWIEGMHIAAVKAGMVPTLQEAQTNNICDYSWSYDFGKLLSFAGGDSSQIKRAKLFGSKPPLNDSLWKAAESQGFEVITEDRNYYTNKEKKIDSGICTAIMEDSYEMMKPGEDEVILVAGDRDYVPTIESLKRRGIAFSICFWDHAAREIKDASNNFYSLNKYHDYLNVNSSTSVQI